MGEQAVAPGWHISRYSGNGAANCAEAGRVPGAVLAPDSRDRGPAPRVTPDARRRFTASLRAGRTGR